MIKSELLQKISYFQGLAVDSPALTRLAATARPVELERRQLLFMEGETDRGLYYLLEGQVRLFKSGAGGREQVLQVVEAGQTFNEVPLLDGAVEPVSAEVLQPGLAWLLPTEAVLEVLATEPGVARAFAIEMAKRLRQLTDLVGDLSLKQVTARVAKILLEQTGPPAILGLGISNEVTAQLTQQEMAAMAGTVREMIGRALRTLQKAGAIEARRGHILIKDAARLATFL